MPHRTYLLLKKCPVVAGLATKEVFPDLWKQKEDVKRETYIQSSNPETEPGSKEERIECKCTAFYKPKGAASYVPIYFSGKEERVCIASIRDRDIDKLGPYALDGIKKHFSSIMDNEGLIEPNSDEPKLPDE